MRKQGLSRADATKQASEWLETKAALHNPDQIAGGRANIIGGLGDKRVNSSIGSQWKYNITEENYKCTTDELGRIVDVKAEELILRKGTRNPGMQVAAGREYRLVDDDGGHLIGTQFRGSGDIDNLLAQNRQINRSGGEWYKMETEWANALKEIPPKKVSVKIKPVFVGTSLRPDSYKVVYEIESKGIFKKTIENRAGG